MMLSPLFSNTPPAFIMGTGSCSGGFIITPVEDGGSSKPEGGGGSFGTGGRVFLKKEGTAVDPNKSCVFSAWYG